MGVVLPGWADELLDLIGVSWPNVDEDDYREMASTMREFADEVDGGAAEAHRAVQRLVSAGGGGAATEALNAHWGKVKDSHLANLAQAGRLSATAMDGVAFVIEGAKVAALVQLGILAAEIAAAAASAPFTFGLSSLAGTAAIQATRMAVKRILKEAAQYAVEEIVNIAMGPVYEALGSMAGDLVVQLGTGALGVQDGVDLGRTAQAGRDGFGQGVDGIRMELLSAGGNTGGGGGGAGGFEFDPGEYDRAETTLDSAGRGMRERAGGRLDRARGSQSRTRGRDPIADAANAMLDRVIGGIQDATRTASRHLDDNMRRGVRQMATNHRDNDERTANSLNAIRSGSQGNTPTSPGSARTPVNSAGTTPASGGSSRGPVVFRPPPNATQAEADSARRYTEGCQRALEGGHLSPTGRVSTSGRLRRQASRAAAAERQRAAQTPTPYQGQAGHVPDTAWTGKPDPPEWLDLPGRVNTSLGGQVGGYPVGYQPTVFHFEETPGKVESYDTSTGKWSDVNQAPPSGSRGAGIRGRP